MSPAGHANWGVASTGVVYNLLMPILAPMGYGWLVPLISGAVGFVAHPPTDVIPHADTVVCGTEAEYEESMVWNPKVLIQEIGLWPIYTKNGREKLAAINVRLAYPPPVEITQTPMRYAYADCMLGLIVTLAWCWLYRGNWLACATVFIGAGCSMAPDFILAGFIHPRLIKHNWFWRWDYFHHWCHAPVMVYKDRILAFTLTGIQFVISGLVAWHFRPQP
jgi:hypothetical protein